MGWLNNLIDKSSQKIVNHFVKDTCTVFIDDVDQVLNTKKQEISEIKSTINELKTYTTKINEHERLLKDNQAIIENSLNAIIDGIMIIDRDEKIIFTNQAFDFICPNAMGMAVFDLIKELKTEYNKCPTIRALNLRKNEHSYIFLETLNKHYHVTACPIKDTKDNVINIVTVYRDITATKQNIKTLEEQKNKIKRLYNNKLVGLFLSAENKKIEFCNDTFLKIFGYTSLQEVQSDYQFNVPKMSEVKNYQEIGSSVNFEIDMKTKNNVPKYLKFIITPVGNGRIEGLVLDITTEQEERKKSNKKTELLENTVKILKMLGESITTETIERSLEIIVKVLDITDGEIFKIKNDTFIPLAKNELLPIGNMLHQHWSEFIGKDYFICGDKNSFDNETRQFMIDQGINSFCVIPIFTLKDLWGIIYLEDKKQYKRWLEEEKDALKIIASVLGGYMLATKLGSKLIKQSFQRNSLSTNS